MIINILEKIYLSLSNKYIDNNQKLEKPENKKDTNIKLTRKTKTSG